MFVGQGAGFSEGFGSHMHGWLSFSLGKSHASLPLQIEVPLPRQ
jgi:hypothetical protein